jgi:hypothetical protein
VEVGQVSEDPSAIREPEVHSKGSHLPALSGGIRGVVEATRGMSLPGKIAVWAYGYVLLTGILSAVLAYVLMAAGVGPAFYSNVALLAAFLVVSSLITSHKLHETYAGEWSRGLWTVLVFVIRFGTLLVAQPGYYALTASSLSSLGITSPILLSVVPSLAVIVTSKAMGVVVREWQRWLGRLRDINDESPTAFLGREFIEGIFTTSFASHLYVFSLLL